MIKIGCCGFPINKKRYFEEFKVIELNTTFYRIPSEEWLKNLRKEAPEDFEFTFKAFQGITHDVISSTWKKSNIPNYKELKGKVGYLRPTKKFLNFGKSKKKLQKF